MPIYVFRAEDGDEIEKFYAMSEVPSIGESIVDFGEMPGPGGVMVRTGKTYYRVPSFIVGSGTIAQHSKYPYISTSLPRTLRGCSLAPAPHSGRMKPLIESRQHEKEVMAINDLVRGGNTFDTE